VAIRSARWKAERTRLQAEKVERDLRNMSRERLLPDDRTLEKVVRYEAHLSCGLYKALHELEALQVRRAALLPWPGWTWTGWRGAKGRAFTEVSGKYGTCEHRALRGDGPCQRRGKRRDHPARIPEVGDGVRGKTVEYLVPDAARPGEGGRDAQQRPAMFCREHLEEMLAVPPPSNRFSEGSRGRESSREEDGYARTSKRHRHVTG
jgi:hypothetical protein